MLKSIEVYFLLFYIYSFFGWAMEVGLGLLKNKKFINRGFLIGPYCPIYGYGVLLITLLLKKYQDDIVITFIMAMLICGILEYYTSLIMEKLFKARWWDYSDRKLNINGRICLENLMAFGILGCLILYITNPFLMEILYQVPNLALHILFSLLFIIYVTDSIVSLKIILNLKNVSKTLRDNTEEISQKVRNIINNRSTFHRRLVNAFPLIEPDVRFNEWKIRNKEKIEKLKNKQREFKENLKKEMEDKKKR